MMRYWTPAVLAIGLGLAPPAWAQSDKLEAAVEAATAQIAANGEAACDEVVGPIGEVVRHKSFFGLPTPVRADALGAMLFCVPYTTKSRPALIAAASLLDPIARTPVQVGLANHYLTMRAVSQKQSGEAADRLLRVASSAPDLIDRYTARFLGSVVAAQRNDPARKKAVLEALYRHSWPQNSWADIEKRYNAINSWAYDYAELLVTEGDLGGARKVVAIIQRPSVLETISTNSEFGALWPELKAAGRFDKAANLRAALLDSEEKIARFPTYLAAYNRHMVFLVEAGRGKEAVDVGLGLIARMAAGESFDDLSTSHAWVWSGIAEAYSALDRTDEEMAALRKAAGSPYSDVSHILNLGSALAKAGKMDEALANATKAKAMGTAPYGTMVLNKIIVCATAKSDPARMKQTLDLMRANWSDGPDNFSAALVCSGLPETEAAAELDKLRATQKPSVPAA